MRKNQRKPNELRTIALTRNYIKYPEGSVLVEFGNTKVLCNASVEKGVPRFLKDAKPKQGWLTAEYSMLPRSTHTRMHRESAGHGPKGRTQEIQRLIGRALRNAIDLKAIPDYTITLDCDVVQADGGTRTVAITGACVALYDAISHLKKEGKIEEDPFRYFIASVSVGIVNNESVLDLDYDEDSNADTDMNLVMDEQGAFIEIQGTAEKNPFHSEHLQSMLALGQEGIQALIQKQKAVLGLVS